MNAKQQVRSELVSKRRGFLALAGAAAATSLFDRIFGIGEAAAQTKPESGAPQRWSVRGLYTEACSCEVGCPCIFASPPSKGDCEALIGWTVDSGQFEGTRLDGFNVLWALYIPAHVLKGNLKLALYIDQRANTAQRAALEAIFSGKAGGPLAGLVPLISEMLPTKTAAIQFQADGKRRRMLVSGIGEIDITALKGADGGDVIVQNSPVAAVSPIILAKSTRQSYRDHGRNWESSERNGFIAQFWYAA
jgi:hypothetical protein